MSYEDLDKGLDRIRAAMNACMNPIAGGHARRIESETPRQQIFAKLKTEQGGNSIQPHRIMDFLSVTPWR
jgi:hypothetical protein